MCVLPHRTLQAPLSAHTFLTARGWVLFFAIFVLFLAVLCQIYGVPDQLKAVIS